MKDDPDVNVRFVQMIESLPELYNHSMQEYCNRTHQNTLWSDVAKKFGGTVHECKEKWKNLRACYTRHLKEKSLLQKTLGSTYSKKPYYLSEYLKFLDPFTKPRKEYACLAVLPPSNQKIAEKRENTDGQEESNATIDDSSNSSFTEDFRTPTETKSPAAKKKKRSIDLEDKDISYKGALEFLIRKKQSENMNEEDPDLCFFKSMLPDMKLMNSDQKRLFKTGILNLSNTIIGGKVGPKKHNKTNSQERKFPLTTNDHGKSQCQNTGSRPTSACSNCSINSIIKEEFID